MGLVEKRDGPGGKKCKENIKKTPLMATAGYSNTPLIKKLGIKETSKVLLFNPPPDYFTLLNSRLDGQLCTKDGLAQQVWPDFDASCLRNGEMTVREARLVTARR